MPPRQQFDRRGPSQQPVAQVVTGGQATTKALMQGRQSGHLKLRGKGLTVLPAETFNIASVVLPEGSAWWETRETLETLDCSQNELTSLSDDISALDQLRELDISRNKITELPAAACWQPLEGLVSLCIGHNALRALPDGLGAANRPPLVRLMAHDNQLSSLPSSLGQLGDLVELDLSHNQLTKLPDGLSGLASLRKLLLSANLLVDLPRDLVASPPPLVDVDLSENRLRDLAFSIGAHLPWPRGMPSSPRFRPSPKTSPPPTVLPHPHMPPFPIRAPATVHTLNVAKNRLATLALDGCAGLQELVAPFNALDRLPSGLPALPALATIDLGSNKLLRLDDLAACGSLTRVDVHSTANRTDAPHARPPLTHTHMSHSDIFTWHTVTHTPGPHTCTCSLLRSERLYRFRITTFARCRPSWGISPSTSSLSWATLCARCPLQVHRPLTTLPSRSTSSSHASPLAHPMHPH